MNIIERLVNNFKQAIYNSLLSISGVELKMKVCYLNDAGRGWGGDGVRLLVGV